MKAKILIVDDEPNILRLIGYSLEVAGYEIVTAKTGVEALKVVELEQPDLIVLDVML
ncbi:MAG: response regulator, partial [Phycisphaerae bacterium]|nr:response regulator [Phycisphaerae bacterium]